MTQNGCLRCYPCLGTPVTHVSGLYTGTKPEKGPKVTKKKIDAGPRLTKKVVTAMHNSFVSMTSELDKAQATDKGTFLLEISPDTMDLLNKLKADMAAKQADETDPNQLPLV